MSEQRFDPSRYLSKVGQADYRGYAFGESPFRGTHELCDDCDGSGHDRRDADGLSCMTCGGWGYVPLGGGDDDA